jgi:hypothetical protein
MLISIQRIIESLEGATFALAFMVFADMVRPHREELVCRIDDFRKLYMQDMIFSEAPHER